MSEILDYIHTLLFVHDDIDNGVVCLLSKDKLIVDDTISHMSNLQNILFRSLINWRVAYEAYVKSRLSIPICWVISLHLVKLTP